MTSDSTGNSKLYSVQDLLKVMARLRDPQSGCPWDLKQDFHTIAPYTLEEAYEVVDAIERNDMPHLKEELGDLLLQVIFHSRMAEEQGSFHFASVVDGLVRKLLRRHPHIFSDRTLQGKTQSGLTPDQVRESWQAIKDKEKASGPETSSILDSIPKNLPALVIAKKLQEKAARVNFDWPDVRPVLAKLREELDEIEEALDQGNQKQVASEVGDFLFAATNLARHLKVDAEQSVRGCNQKFRNRFAYIEQRIRELGKEMEDCSLEELDALWDESKKKELSQ